MSRYSDHQYAMRMRELLYGQLVSRALCVAVRLGVPDVLDACALSVEELAAKVSAEPAALHRLLRLLAAYDVVEESEGRVGLTPLGRTLCSTAVGTAQPTALLLADEIGATWSNLEHTIRTGESAFVEMYRTDLFTYLERNPGPRQIFDRSQAAGLSLELDEIFAHVDFDAYSNVVDVGGGDGKFLCWLLHRYPDSTGVVVEMPGTVPLAEQRIAAEGLTGRCRAVCGDFFRAVPADGDLYLLSHVLHDWDDERAVAILRTCREAMSPRARVMVIDLVTDGARGDRAATNPLPAVMDLYMLSLFGTDGGRERTASGFGTLFDRAGLTVEEARVLPSGMAVITAMPSHSDERD